MQARSERDSGALIDMSFRGYATFFPVPSPPSTGEREQDPPQALSQLKEHS